MGMEVASTAPRQPGLASCDDIAVYYFTMLKCPWWMCTLSVTIARVLALGRLGSNKCIEQVPPGSCTAVERNKGSIRCFSSSASWRQSHSGKARKYL